MTVQRSSLLDVDAWNLPQLSEDTILANRFEGERRNILQHFRTPFRFASNRPQNQKPRPRFPWPTRLAFQTRGTPHVGRGARMTSLVIPVFWQTRPKHQELSGHKPSVPTSTPRPFQLFPRRSPNRPLSPHSFGLRARIHARSHTIRPFHRSMWPLLFRTPGRQAGQPTPSPRDERPLNGTGLSDLFRRRVRSLVLTPSRTRARAVFTSYYVVLVARYHATTRPHPRIHGPRLAQRGDPSPFFASLCAP